MKQLKSRTVIFMTLMASLQSAATALTFLTPFLTEKEFALVSAAIAFITPVVGVYLRQVTTGPVGQGGK